MYPIIRYLGFGLYSDPGVTGLELLVDFVLCTSCIPRIKSSTGEGYVNVLETALHAPTTIRSWVQAVLEASRQHARFATFPLLPKKRNQVPALNTLGYTACRSGLQSRPRWHQPDANLALLKQVLRDDCVTPLIHHAKLHEQQRVRTDENILRQYVSFSKNERDRLARRLRGGRGRCSK